MGVPSVNITFREMAQTVKRRSDVGVVGLILKDTKEAVISVTAIEDVTEDIKAENKKQIELALRGAGVAPKKIIAYVLGTDSTDYTKAFSCFEDNRIDYLVVPTVATDTKTDTVTSWITKVRAEGLTTKAVLPNANADNFGIINFTTDKITEGETEYSTEEYCSRIAGILASTPLTQSCTYTAIPEITACSKISKVEESEAVENGELVIFWDGEKAKISRGVNSYTTATAEQGEQFKKIRTVSVIDVIQNDLRKLTEDNYIGKFVNTYDNKIVLIAAIGDYLETLKSNAILQNYKVEIDIEGNKKHLIAHGVDTSDMTDTEIIEANTNEIVYLRATISINDAIEDIVLPIAI